MSSLLWTFWQSKISKRSMRRTEVGKFHKISFRKIRISNLIAIIRLANSNLFREIQKIKCPAQRETHLPYENGKAEL